MRILRSATAAIAVLLLAWPPAAGASAPARHGWLAGLGVGGGGAQVVDDRGTSQRRTGYGFSLRAGYAFDPQLSLELASNAWVKSDTGERTSFNVLGAVLCFYPGGKGFFVRGGGGLGKVEVALTSWRGVDTFTTNETGLGLTAGAGYEFRVKRQLGIGPQLDFAWTDQGSFRTNHFTAMIGLTWYTVKR